MLLPRLASLLRNLSRKNKVERDLSEEVRSSVELLTRVKTKEGVSEREARRAALMEFGGAGAQHSAARRAALPSVLGRRFRFENQDEAWQEIVGVVRHVRHSGLDEEPRVKVYRPWTQLNPKRTGD